ncbi:MAG: hypothetical protein VKI81_05530 [Synechococcaceae cyanobacterium]|nr:hypothetical protein [Synechococcaceae cyanobacterium]
MSLPCSSVALRRHRLPRFWLALTLGSLAVTIGVVYWWERQLPRRLAEAIAEGRIDDCLRYSEQLAALSWLPGPSPREEGRCRREKALQLWQAGTWGEAMAQQRRLASSPFGTDADRQRLAAWEEDLRRQAVASFQGGDLEAALAFVAPLDQLDAGEGRTIAEELRDIWNRNRLQHERAGRLVGQARWWEALDALNRIDHPWWQKRSAPLRRQVQEGLAKLAGAQKERDVHGGLPHTVPAESLDALVQKRIASGMDEWQAFQEACRELGGRIVEAGPESACQR